MTYVLVWIAVTTTAVFVATAAVGSVRDRVTETPAAMVPTTANTLSGSDVSTTTTEPGATSGTSEPAAATTPTTSTTTTTTTVVVSTTEAPEAPEAPEATTTTTPPPPPPPPTTTTTTSTTTTVPPSTEIRSYDLVGGSVTVEVGNNMVNLAGASPKAGFGMDVENSGPEKVEVEFESEDHDSHFSARFEDGVFVPRIEEEAHEEDS
jgi:hypothetical protein